MTDPEGGATDGVPGGTAGVTTGVTADVTADVTAGGAPEGAAVPEESGRLLLEHRDGVLVLRLTGGGSVIPKAIPVVDDGGRLLAVYSAGTAVRPAPGGERDLAGGLAPAAEPPVPVADTFEVGPPHRP